MPNLEMFLMISVPVSLFALATWAAWYFGEVETTSDVYEEEAEITDTDYESRHTSTNVVPTFSSKGGMGMGISTSSTPERFQLSLRSKTFKYYIVNSEPLFEEVHRGDKLRMGIFETYSRPRREPEARPALKAKKVAYFKLSNGNKVDDFECLKKRLN